jgi:hypothetical protein
MEAKGGIIRYSPESNQWTSTDPFGETHNITDPFGQAGYNKYGLRAHLTDKVQPRPGQRINMGHAVAFPEVTVKEAWLGPNKPRQIILDQTGLTDLSAWVSQALAYWRGQSPQQDTVSGEEAIKALMDLLGKDVELRPALWGDVLREQEQFIRLTQEQYRILDVLNRQRRAAICGCAGSGKTMLAAEKATRLARQGFRVLFTCFNKALAADLRQRLGTSPNLEIVHFHELCYRLAQQAGVLPVKKDSETFFDQQLPQVLIEAAEALEVSYDAIVVDEGQDFQNSWWLPLQMLLRDPDDGILYIFFDDNQRLYVPHSEFPIQDSPFLLTYNCRNTQNIHDVVIQFYAAGARPEALGPRGRRIEEITYSDFKLIWPTLQDVLERLTEEDQVPADQIAVLTPSLRIKEALLSSAAFGGPQLTDSVPLQPGQVYCTTIHSFKGLERAVIILVGIGQQRGQEERDLNSLLYVGCSRARHHLIVLLPKNADLRVKKAFAKARSK